MKPTHPHRWHYASADGIAPIPQLLAGASPDSTYVLDGDDELSVADIRQRAGGLQRTLVELGVEKGDVVAAQLPNWWQTIAAAHAVWSLGAVLTPITPIYRRRDLATIFALAQPKTVLVPNSFRGVAHPLMVEDALRDAGHTAHLLQIEHETWAYGEATLHTAPSTADDIAMLMYTSGTTGTPKGVLHSHRTLLAESQSIADVFGLQGDRVFMPSPLTHITGLLYGVLMPLQISGAVVLLDRWDPAAAVEVVERTRCTTTVAATPFLSGLAERYAERGHRSCLRSFVCGGADIPAALVRRAEQTMGTRVARTYGSTELPTLCTVPPGLGAEVRYTTEGPVIGEARARLADGTGQVRELEVHGPELFLGYLDEQHNDDAFTDDGWFRTGDLARIDGDGNITIVGRVKDVIVRGGENISAREVEDVLLEMPGVADAAVVGVPDEVLGERACAVLVTRGSSAAPDFAGMQRHLLGEGIAKQKFPEHLLVVPELPRTASGKIQKFLVRQWAIQHVEQSRD